jgi:hypothetical protein
MLKGIISHSMIATAAHINVKQDAGAEAKVYDKDGNEVTDEPIPSTGVEENLNG